ncbi:MAG: Gfo/Idh/MocA family oxidoreductase [Robiginitalea sp.]
MDKRDFIKKSSLGAVGLALAPSFLKGAGWQNRLRTAHIGVGNMGAEDLKAISSHPLVDVVALCDVDATNLGAAHKLHPGARVFFDYRVMLRDMKDQIDAVIVSTPDHTHAPASLMAMQLEKPVYCQKPLTHHVSEAREMKKVAMERNLVTQMGIQVHSFYDYKLATLLIQSGIIGKVHAVRAWSPKNWGYDGSRPGGNDAVPQTLDWNLWQGTAPERPYKEGFYHPGNWRKLLDYGCGTLGDMGVHIFDTPYNALELDVPLTVRNECRPPTGFGFPEKNTVTYEFPGTPYTADTLTWVWYDGPGAPPAHPDLTLPDNEPLHDQGAMFMGEKGRLYLPHFMKLPQLIVDGKYADMDLSGFDLGDPVTDYDSESKKHYHQFVDACLGTTTCTAPFSYAARLTETILLGVVAGRFPGQTLHWEGDRAQFREAEANTFLTADYREF